MLDLAFDEDHSQVPERTAARDLWLLREVALEALRDEPSRRSPQSRRKRAAFDPDFRFSLCLALEAWAVG